MAARPRRLPWAELLRRVHKIDVLRCTRCTGRLRILAFLTDPCVILAILPHLGLPTTLPRPKPARSPPQQDLDFGDSPTSSSSIRRRPTDAPPPASMCVAASCAVPTRLSNRSPLQCCSVRYLTSPSHNRAPRANVPSALRARARDPCSSFFLYPRIAFAGLVCVMSGSPW